MQEVGKIVRKRKVGIARSFFRGVCNRWFHDRSKTIFLDFRRIVPASTDVVRHLKTNRYHIFFQNRLNSWKTTGTCSDYGYFFPSIVVLHYVFSGRFMLYKLFSRNHLMRVTERAAMNVRNHCDRTLYIYAMWRMMQQFVWIQQTLVFNSLLSQHFFGKNIFLSYLAQSFSRTLSHVSAAYLLPLLFPFKGRGYMQHQVL